MVLEGAGQRENISYSVLEIGKKCLRNCMYSCWAQEGVGDTYKSIRDPGRPDPHHN